MSQKKDMNAEGNIQGKVLWGRIKWNLSKHDGAGVFKGLAEFPQSEASAVRRSVNYGSDGCATCARQIMKGERST
jgi:hypothetical protein